MRYAISDTRFALSPLRFAIPSLRFAHFLKFDKIFSVHIKNMKILMQSRISLFKIPGGDTIQILKTKEYLEKLGVKVDISLNYNIDLSNYDLVHFFHFFRIHEAYISCKNAKKQNKKFILTPIYVSKELRNNFEKSADLGIIKYINKIVGEEMRERLKGVWHYFIDKERNIATKALILKGYNKLMKETIKEVDMILPNSKAEMDMLIRDFPGNYTYRIIPNGVDGSLFKNEVSNNKYLLPPDALICVARIEPRKNQLSLIKAVMDTDIKLILIGNPMKNRMSYYNKVQKYKSENIRIMHNVEHNELNYIYSNARVHALPSWFESPGLSSLEAAAMGCNIVVSNQDIIREYFQDYAFYCEPNSIESIKKAILTAYHTERKKELKDYILHNFTWEKIAKLTLEAYEIILSRQ